MSELTGTVGPPPTGKRLAGLSLAALGVVYGDIGTSPLYAVRECFFGHHGVKVTDANILGVLSLIFWSLIIVISLKYLVVVMRADNRGEGGILALMALVRPDSQRRAGSRWILIALGLFGAALLYGDGMITPAISVLSAVEGLNVTTSVFQPYVVPITIGILIGLFLFQRHGTARVGSIFGPIMVLWFSCLAVLGVTGIVREPGVLVALNPYHALAFFVRDHVRGFLVLGAVFLVVTGGEALYADMGHFGKRPIRLTWFLCVLPALVLNYFGQGALLLQHPEAAHNPFYRLAPGWALYPLVLLATVATVIASQAVISGAFSLAHQAVQLGYSPRLKVVHTSSHEIGQIYIPSINWILMFSTVALVLGFRASTNLAAAYGIAVTTTMVITTMIISFVARQLWHWKMWMILPMLTFFLIVDLAFFGSNLIKVEQGGWVPLMVAGIAYTLMSTWNRGRRILRDRLTEGLLPIDSFLSDISTRLPQRVPGLAVFMTSNPGATPTALLHNLKHNKVLHERVILLTIVTSEIPHVPDTERIEGRALGEGFYEVIAHYGFMQDPDVPAVLTKGKTIYVDYDMMQTTFFLGSETLIPSSRASMALWRKKLFAVMSRNALRATEYFRIPPNRVIELGVQVEL